MCGIAGAIGRIEPDMLRAVQSASECQRHRGPDDDGFWQSGDAGSDGARLLTRKNTGGHRNNRQVFVIVFLPLANSFRDFETVHFRHLNIKEDQIIVQLLLKPTV